MPNKITNHNNMKGKLQTKKLQLCNSFWETYAGDISRYSQFRSNAVTDSYRIGTWKDCARWSFGGAF